jgi:hypothetical protein
MRHSSGGGGELLDGASFDEGGEGLFNDGSCSTGPYTGSLSLKRDRRGGIVVGFAGHEELGNRKRWRS